MTPQDFLKFPISTVFSAPLILQFGLSQLAWNARLARQVPRPATWPSVSSELAPGGFCSQVELQAYQRLLQMPQSPSQEVLSNVPLSSIFAIDGKALDHFFDTAGFSPSQRAFAHLKVEGQIGQKSVDLLVIDKLSQDILFGLEVDSEYHAQDDQITHDLMKSAFFRLHGIPLLRLYSQQVYRAHDWSAFSLLLERARQQWQAYVRHPTCATMQAHMPPSLYFPHWWAATD